MRTRLVAATALLGALAACGAEDPTYRASDNRTSNSSPTSATREASPEPTLSPSVKATGRGQKVVAGESDYGSILFGDTGQAIYLFDVETTSRPRCYGPCAEAWPPVLTDGAPHAGKRVKQSLLGTTQRTDGTTQVTYDGHPLYFYAHEGTHEVTCHDVFLNGGTWYAIQPDGHPAP